MLKNASNARNASKHINVLLIEVDRLASGVRVCISFQKIPRLVGYLGSGLRIPPRGSDRVRSTGFSASFHIFDLRILLV